MEWEGSSNIAKRLRQYGARRDDEADPEEPRPSNVAHLEQRTERVAAGGPDTGTGPQPQRLLGELSRASQSLAEVLDELTAEKRELEVRLAGVQTELERAREDAAGARREAAEAVGRAREDAATARREAAAEVERANDEAAAQVEAVRTVTAEKQELESRAARLEAELERAREETASTRRDATEQIERARDEAAGQLSVAARDAARHRARAARAEQLLALVGGERETTAFCITVARRRRRRVSRDLLRQAVTDGVELHLSAHRGWRDTVLLAELEGPPGALRKFLAWARDQFAADDLREPNP